MRRMRGGLALMALMLVVLAVPVVLIHAGHLFGPDHVPGWAEIWGGLTGPDDGSIVAGLLLVAGWLAWIYLTVAVGSVLVARVQRRPLPRVGLLRPGQAVARVLVTAAAGLFLASSPLSAAASPLPAAGAPVTPGTLPGHAGAGPSRAPVTLVPAEAGAETPTPYTERVVERGDSLWAIAEAELDDPTRWPELFALTAGVDQPTGWPITDPDEIDVGQVVRVPSGTPAAEAATPTECADPVLADHTGDGAGTAAGPTTAPAQDWSGPGAGASADPGVTPATTPAASAAPTQPAPTATATTATAVDDGLDGSTLPVSALGGVGSILAAGVIAVVGRNRARQNWRRGSGRRLPLPAGEDAVVEARLHLVENRALVAKADQALRALVEGCAEEGLDLPGLRAARLTDDHFQLFLTQPGPLPAPWVRTVDPSVWTCAFARLGPDPADGPAPGVTDAAAGTLGPEMAAGPAADAADVADVADPVAPAADDLPPAPYPALVCVGQDEEAAHLLLDLEQAGVLGVTGPAPFAAEAMAALAVELATSPWADDLTVTTTGALADLEARLGTGRLHHVTNLGPVVDGLAHRADLARAALVGADLGTDRSGLGPLHSARVHGVAGDAWYPEVLVLAGDVAADAAAALADLVAGEPRVAVAAVTAEPDLMGEYRIEFDGSGRATLQPFGLPFTPQRLSPAVLDSVSRIVRLAQVPVAAPADPLAFAELVAAAPELAAFAEPAPPLGRGVRPGRLGEEHVILRGGAPAPESQDPAAAPDTASDPAHPADPDAATPAVDEAEWAELVAALEGKPLATASPVEPDAAPARGPYLRLLGTVDVVGATGGVEASKVKRLTELLAFLVLHPGAAVADLDEAIWPDRAGENAGTRNTAVSKLRRWLGQTPDGEPYLPAFTYDASAVGCDWLDWQRLIGAGPLSQVPTERLAQAFGLIRGAPFAGVNRRGYRWSDRFHREMLAAIADVGEELARRRCQARDFTSAQTVLATALALVPGEERLWRLRVLTSYVTGDRESAKAAIASLWEWSDNLGLDLEAETLRLIAQVQHTPLLDGRMKPRSERRPTTPKPKTTA